MEEITKKLSCILVDDEPLALDILEDYAKKVPYLDIAGSFDNGIETLRFLKEHSIDLIFLDIQMPNLTGLQLLEILRDPPMIVFTTAYEEYALTSYEYDAIDYLMKPIGFERFLKSVEKSWSRKYSAILQEDETVLKSKSNDLSPTHEKGYLFVKTEYRMQRILIKDILYIEGMKNYLRIATHDTRIMTLSSFKNIEDILPDSFQRIHKSFIVAIDKIDNIERNRVKIGDKIFPVSETYKEDFYRKINERSL